MLFAVSQQAIKLQKAQQRKTKNGQKGGKSNGGKENPYRL